MDKESKYRLIPTIVVGGAVSYELLENTGKYPDFPDNILIFGDLHVPNQGKADISIEDFLPIFPNSLFVMEYGDYSLKRSEDVKVSFDPKKGSKPYFTHEEIRAIEGRGELILAYKKLIELKKPTVLLDDRSRINVFQSLCSNLSEIYLSERSYRHYHSILSRSYGYYNAIKKEGSLFRPYKDLFDNVKKCSGQLSSFILRELLRCRRDELKCLDEIKKYLDSRVEIVKYSGAFYKHAVPPDKLNNVFSRWKADTGGVLHKDKRGNRFVTTSTDITQISSDTKSAKVLIRTTFSNDVVILRFGVSTLVFDIGNYRIIVLGDNKQPAQYLYTNLVNNHGGYISFITRSDRGDDFYYIKKNGYVGPMFPKYSKMDCGRIILIYSRVYDMAILSTLCANRLKYDNKYENVVMYAGNNHLVKVSRDLQKLGMYRHVCGYRHDSREINVKDGISIRIDPKDVVTLSRRFNIPMDVFRKVKSRKVIKAMEDLTELINYLVVFSPEYVGISEYEKKAKSIVDYYDYITHNRYLLPNDPDTQYIYQNMMKYLDAYLPQINKNVNEPIQKLTKLN